MERNHGGSRWLFESLLVHSATIESGVLENRPVLEDWRILSLKAYASFSNSQYSASVRSQPVSITIIIIVHFVDYLRRVELLESLYCFFHQSERQRLGWHFSSQR
jgi:hypothetical protein